ncbi:MAG: S8 family serine peptidase [Pseudomonadota bacterium]
MRLSPLASLLLALLTGCLAITPMGASAQFAAPPPEADDRDDTDDDDDNDRRRSGGSRDVVLSSDGRPEYIISAPVSAAGATRAALIASGVEIDREVFFPGLDRRTFYFDLPQGVRIATVQTTLAQFAPPARLGLHHVYRFAQGSQPRVYAAAMVGAGAPGRCPLPRRVRVGVIDGPVDPDHTALQGVRLTRHSVLPRRTRTPDTSHGTAVAALIAGARGAGPLAGYATGADVIAVSAFARSQSGEAANLERIGAALDYLVRSGAQIVNMSFAGARNAAFADLLAAAAGRGTILVAAVGNDPRSQATYPAAAPPVIAVTAVDAAGRRYRSATMGAHLDLAAPGVDLFAAKGPGGGYLSGTSYAAPIVTAFAAHLVARGVREPEAVRSRLRAAARDLGRPGPDTEFGFGLVQSPGC